MKRLRRLAMLSVAASLLASLLTLGCGGPITTVVEFDEANAQVIREEFEFGSVAGGQGGSSLLVDENRQPQWATMRGHVRVQGSVPDPIELNIQKDQAVCKPGGKPVYSDVVTVGQGGGLQNALIFLNTDLPKLDADDENPVWVHPSYSFVANPALRQVEFDQKNCVFLSRVFAMRSDQIVKILNSDPVVHNTKLEPRNAVPINPLISGNSSTLYEPKRQEDAPFAVSCSIHPWMSAWMISRYSPYYAVTAEDGSFEIANLPAGVPLEYRIWQEKVGFLTETVKLNDEDFQLKRGRFALDPPLQADETKTLEFVIDGSAFQ